MCLFNVFSNGQEHFALLPQTYNDARDQVDPGLRCNGGNYRAAHCNLHSGLYTCIDDSSYNIVDYSRAAVVLPHGILEC